MNFNSLYKNNNSIYGLAASPWVVNVSRYISAPASVLDIGIGQGRNALYLSRLGYSVTGVDSSDVGIEQTKLAALNEGISINLITSDIKQYIYDDLFDVILSTASLQYIGNANEIFSEINRIKNNTKFSGLNVISVPTRTKIAMKMPYYFSFDTLVELYSDWELLELKEIEDTFSTGAIGTIAYLIAKKVS
ncbi:MAG: methyltransferase domain-containing protein [Candidatus Dojkabacteria bacterium]|nr:methyltransferase domain-containing protein [Candidatus Dojkabacteria bacterium]MDQ7020559.1 methyltransferase domain-containing protein [Candidatus Dojkabacteria bacterium]